MRLSILFSVVLYSFSLVSILNTFLSMCSSSLLITCPALQRKKFHYGSGWVDPGHTQNLKFGWRWVGGVSSIQFFLDLWNVLTLQSPLPGSVQTSLGDLFGSLHHALSLFLGCVRSRSCLCVSLCVYCIWIIGS